MSDDSGAWADRQRLNLQGWLRGARADLGLPDEPAAEVGENDHLIQATDNGLRPEDAALAQPPQDRDWQP